jgi:hypothetical protein
MEESDRQLQMSINLQQRKKSRKSAFQNSKSIEISLSSCTFKKLMT